MLRRILIASAWFLFLESVVMAQTNLESELIKRIKDLDGKVTRSPKSEGGSIIGIEAIESDLDDMDLKKMASLLELKWLWLSADLVTDKGVKELVALAKLRQLALHASKVTNEGLRPLCSSRTLKSCICTVQI